MSAVQDDSLNQAEKGVAVEQAPPPAEPASQKIPCHRRKLWLGVGLLVVLVAVGLTVGLVVSSQKQENEASQTGLVGNGNEGETTGSTAAPPTSTSTSTTTTTDSPSDGPENNATATTKPPVDDSPTDPPMEEQLYYQSKSGIFNVSLPLFSSNVATGYSDESELEQDLIEVAKFKVNRAVETPRYFAMPGVIPEDEAAFADTTAGDGAAAAAPGSPAAGDIDDYGTNTVEDSIDEGDLLKTNGEFAFAAYGQHVIVLDVTTGDEVTKITLPSFTYDGQTPPIEPYEIKDTEDVVHSDGDNDGTRRNKRNLQFIGAPYYWPVEPTVQSLLLHGDRLVVVANGYGQFVQSTLDYRPVLYDAFSTNIRLYDISQLGTAGEVTFLNETHIHGTFNSIRADENRVHVVTFSGLDTWSYLEQPLDRYKSEFSDLDDDEYYAAARELSEEVLIPEFVTRLMQDVSVDGQLPNLSRVSMWQQRLSTDSKLEDTVFSQGVINYYAQVTSFDMLEPTGALDGMLSLAGTFMPTSWGHTYATDEMMVIAGQGWDWIPETGGSLQTTYLHGFALLQDGRAVPAATGSLEGSLLNEYAVDVVGDYMRVAVTIRNDMWTFPLEEGGGEGAPITMPPRTENYIVVLEIPPANPDGSAGVLNEVGRTQSLGEDGEVFMSVRFSDKIAYAVTFERTDPFYVVSFEDETNPEVLGELKITGFASYLHFVNEANTLLLGVGQEADDDGGIRGLQVTLYDATDPTEPSVIERYPFELDPDVYSSSAAEFDFKAFRYVKLGDDFGILIIPLRVDSYSSTEGNFDGFVLLDVNATNITERFTIPHVDSADFRLGCYYWARLADRSFVVDGDVTTFKGHSIRNYNLDTGERLWGIDLDEGMQVAEVDHCIFW